jgi:uncharacterized protein YciI
MRTIGSVLFGVGLLACACASEAIGESSDVPASAQAAAASGTAKSKAEAPEMAFEQYQLVLLVRPENAPDLPEERIEEIQTQHLAHLTKMGEEGYMVIAGPFSDQPDERLRGLCLYRVGSLDRAKELAGADPAVKAGRLEIEAMTWWVEEGYMTFPKAPPMAAGAPTTRQ